MGFAKKIPGAAGFLNFTSKTSGLRALVGKDQFASMDLGGQVAGIYDDKYKPKDVQPIPSADVGSDPLVAADRMRRLAKRASGLDSTIRTSPAGATLYSAQPKVLLGS
jgi:hypothetical protein